jgi:hypothetical protein
MTSVDLDDNYRQELGMEYKKQQASLSQLSEVMSHR